MKDYLGYVRVSTQRQGRGVSLAEQRDAIMRYAAREGFRIVDWFEERESASKKGRPVFARMMRRLEKGKAIGVVVHKVDRSARNHSDWAELNVLADRGFDVRFAADGIDLRSRGNRLVADVQAVVAMDYSRNLRDEVRKGLYGRLKQGMYPFAAPVGYVNCGGGRPKEPHPVMGPLVQQAFELYATGKYCLDTLAEEMFTRGLRSHGGSRVGRSSLSKLLNNPFYAGVIRILRTGQTFAGIHPPLISKAVFHRVRDVLLGKTPHRQVKHDFVYRRLLTCGTCGRSLIGELRKGHTYYRCHTPDHATTAVRQESVDDALAMAVSSLSLAEDERSYAREALAEMAGDAAKAREAHDQALTLRKQRATQRLQKLTDALLDDLVDKPAFDERRTALRLEERQIQEDQAKGPLDPAVQAAEVLRYLGLGEAAVFLFKTWTVAEKRDLLVIMMSDRSVTGKNIAFALAEPFQSIAARETVHCGGPKENRTPLSSLQTRRSTNELWALERTA